MALIYPLKLGNDGLQEAEATDTLAIPASEVDVYSYTSGEALTKFNPVYISNNDTVSKAKADALATVKCVGLAKASVGGAASVSVQHNGAITGTTGEWDSVTGGSGGLVAGTLYYLDPDTAGNLTTTIPTASGDFYKPIGQAISTTTMVIEIGNHIKRA